MSKVSIVECKSYNQKEVDASVKKAIEQIGFKIKSNSKVLLKPNILMAAKPDKAITTHPSILEAVCKILKEKNCKIIIGESFGIITKSPEETFKIVGYDKVAKKYNAELLSFSSDLQKEVNNPKAVFAKKMLLPITLSEVDLIINLPKFKTHTLMMFTGGVKNLFGCIAGGKKQAYHAETKTREKFANMLLDIWMNVKPQLTIMDGIIGMDGNGPSNGNLVKLDLIMASDNAIALDLVAEEMIGFKGKILTNNFALKRKLIDKEKIEVKGKIRKIKFKKPSTIAIPIWLSSFVLKRVMAYPEVLENKCKRCWTCVKVCPVGAMQKKEFPVCNKKTCINCYCCHEMCPYNAIELEKNKFFTFILRTYYKINNLKKIKRK
ncbi:MAG: DUF362 domain-containing protein [Nanoarchaeota archaeon]|nr:DUF362 domain-containing protein [Nanoarchaeota archaeon]